MTALHQAFLTDTSFTSSLQAASSAVSGLSQGTSRQDESGARRNPIANPMHDTGILCSMLCYTVVMLFCYVVSPSLSTDEVWKPYPKREKKDAS